MAFDKALDDKFETSTASPVILNHRYLDDEQLSKDEQLQALKEIFEQNIRQKEIDALVAYLRPTLRGQHPPHISLLGKAGVGKTATALLILSHLQQVAQRKGVELRYEHLDLTTPRPCFRAMNDLACLLDASKRYTKGISIDEMAGRIEDKLSGYKGYLVLFVDEIDHVNTDMDNTFLKFLVRRLPQAIPAKLILIFASNRLGWRQNIDSRVKSFLKVNDIIFDPYNAVDLQKILRVRVTKALNAGMVDAGVVEKIAGLASREHGDARKAVELLSNAALIAERQGTRVRLETVDAAYEALETNSYLEFVKCGPPHLQAVLYAAILCLEDSEKHAVTEDIYNFYSKVCDEAGLSQLSERRVYDLLLELELYGYIRSRKVSLGRHGRRKEMKLLIPPTVISQLKSRIQEHLKG